MYTFPIPTLYVQMDPSATIAWDKLQAAVGDGMLTAILSTPERHGDTPLVQSVLDHPDALVPDLVAAQLSLSNLVVAWRKGIERLMNTRWNLVENPFARFSIVRGAILCHEDPLGWMVDEYAADIAEGETPDSPCCALLVPVPTSNHALLSAAAHAPNIPHAELFARDLTAAALDVGHDSITPLAWVTQPVAPDESNTLIMAM